MNRREFLKYSAMAGTVWTASPALFAAGQSNRLRILVLGGTHFVGPAIVSAALRQNHEVTLFNRGITNPELFGQLPLVRGDRNQGIEAFRDLDGRNWDLVIDVWPEQANLVDHATTFFASRTKHYIFISSIAVYNDFQEVGLHEESSVVDLTLSTDQWHYPEEKLAAENFVRSRFPASHTILRPGPIKGWRDPALDLLYWCLKLNRDNAIIAPGSGLDPLQFIDVNDVGRFAIQATENQWTGTYNCTGPRNEPLLWREFLQITKAHFNSRTELHWAPEDFLKQHRIASFSDLPLWAPLSEDRGFMQISNEKLNQTGFTLTAIGTTLDDCMNWHAQSVEAEPQFGTSQAGLGLTRDMELELIRALQE